MKRWELALVMLVTVGILSMLMTVLLEKPQIAIVVLPPHVETAYDFDPQHPTQHLSPRQKVDVIGRAVTQWEFKSWAKIDYNVESTEQTKDSYLVTLKIKRVELTLGLPIKIHLPKDATEQLKMHELGHVQICERVYEQSEGPARKAVEAVFSRQYSGSGKTIEEARAAALNVASSEIAQSYQESTRVVVDDVSEIYDFLQKKPGAAPSECVQQSFKIYIGGKPRRLTSSPAS